MLTQVVGTNRDAIVTFGKLRFQMREVGQQETHRFGCTGDGSFIRSLAQELCQPTIDSDLGQHDPSFSLSAL